MQDINYFSTRFGPNQTRTKLWPVLVKYLQRRFIPEDAVVLDIGAGYCDFINNVRAKEKHAVDVSTIPAEYASSDSILHVCPCSDLRDLGDGYFDIVFASNLFEHLEREEFLKTLGEVKRVLKTGGKLIVLQPNYRLCYKSYFDDYTHLQIFTDRSLTDILKVYRLNPIVVIPRFLPFSVQSSVLPYPWLLWIYLHLPLRPFAGQMLLVAENPGA